MSKRNVVVHQQKHYYVFNWNLHIYAWLLGIEPLSYLENIVHHTQRILNNPHLKYENFEFLSKFACSETKS